MGRWMITAGSTGVTTKLFDLGDTLEIDECDHWIINRQRIPLRDVVLITQHSESSLAMAIVTLILSSPFAIMAYFIGTNESAAAAWGVFGFLSLPFILISLYLFFTKISVLTIQSRRVTATLRKRHGHKKLAIIVKDIGTRVARLQQVQATPTPAVAPLAAPDELPNERLITDPG